MVMIFFGSCFFFLIVLSSQFLTAEGAKENAEAAEGKIRIPRIKTDYADQIAIGIRLLTSDFGVSLICL
jgi:hypothetical protein